MGGELSVKVIDISDALKSKKAFKKAIYGKYLDLADHSTKLLARQRDLNRITEWFGVEETLKIISFQPPYIMFFYASVYMHTYTNPHYFYLGGKHSTY